MRWVPAAGRLTGPDSSSLHDPPARHPAGAPLRLRLQPRLLLQAPRLHEAPRVDIRHPLRTAQVACGPRSGSRSAWAWAPAAGSCTSRHLPGAAVGRPGRPLRRRRPHRRHGRPPLRLRGRSPPVVGPRAHRAGLILLGVTMPSHRRRALDLLAGRDGRLRGRALRHRRRCSSSGPRAGAPAEHHGVMLAAASGILFGVCNVAVKALSGMVGDAGMLGLVSARGCVVAAAGSATAFYASARSLQDGEAVEVIAITGTAANISCIAGGIIVFGDPLPGDAVGIALQALAFVLVIVASALTPAPVRSARARAPPPPPRPAGRGCAPRSGEELGDLVDREAAAGVEQVEGVEAGQEPQHVGGVLGVTSGRRSPARPAGRRGGPSRLSGARRVAWLRPPSSSSAAIENNTRRTSRWAANISHAGARCRRAGARARRVGDGLDTRSNPPRVEQVAARRRRARRASRRSGRRSSGRRRAAARPASTLSGCAGAARSRS